MRILILCNGPTVCLAGNLPKQLTPVDGEPILHRTVRLLRERGQDDITVVGSDSDLMVKEAKWFSPGVDEPGQPAGLSSSELWSYHQDNILLLGDVFYTKEAINTILETPVKTWTLFCRFGYNPDGSLGGGEGWAVKFPSSENFRYLRTLDKLSRGGLPVCHFWQQYRAMNFANPLEHKDLGNRVIIDDLTEDFDSFSDYRNWLRRYHS